jgi:hypothetical protein
MMKKLVYHIFRIYNIINTEVPEPSSKLVGECGNAANNLMGKTGRALANFRGLYHPARHSFDGRYTV